MQGFAMWSRVKELKVRKHLALVGALRTFRAWANWARAQVQERQLAHFEAEQKALLRIEQFAKETFERNTKVKVVRALKAYADSERAQKAIEKEHEARKAQIDGFFQNLRQKVASEATEKEQARVDEELKTQLKEKARKHVQNVALLENHCTGENLESKVAEQARLQELITITDQMSSRKDTEETKS